MGCGCNKNKKKTHNLTIKKNVNNITSNTSKSRSLSNPEYRALLLKRLRTKTQ